MFYFVSIENIKNSRSSIKVFFVRLLVVELCRRAVTFISPGIKYYTNSWFKFRFLRGTLVNNLHLH